MSLKSNDNNSHKKELTSFAEGVGRMLAMIMLLLRALAIGVICYFLYCFVEPLLH